MQHNQWQHDTQRYRHNHNNQYYKHDGNAQNTQHVSFEQSGARAVPTFSMSAEDELPGLRDASDPWHEWHADSESRISHSYSGRNLRSP
eukprot:5560356-Alexandrium_andersonii.AAC.1